MNSCQKGKRGEREAAAAIREALNVSARRGQQFSGGKDSPDIVTDVPGVHFEVKRTETFNLYAALNQSMEDASDKLPVVLHRRNKQPWVVVLRLGDVPQFAAAINSLQDVGQ